MSNEKKAALSVRDCRYGYRLDNDLGRLVIDPATASAVKEIFALYLGGAGISEIAGMMQDRGVISPMEYKKKLHGGGPAAILHGAETAPCRQPRGNFAWSRKSVRNILKTDLYTGRSVKNGARNPVTIHAEPLIDYVDYDRARRMLERGKTGGRIPIPVSDGETGRAVRCEDGRYILKTGAAILGKDLLREISVRVYREHEDALAALRRFRTSDCLVEELTKPLRRRAAKLFEEMYLAMEHQDEEKIIRCNDRFYALTRAKQEIMTLYSPRNPWTRLHGGNLRGAGENPAANGSPATGGHLTEGYCLTEENLKKRVKSVRLTDAGGKVAVNVIFRRSQFKERLPEEWFGRK